MDIVLFLSEMWCLSPTTNAAEGLAHITRTRATGTATKIEGEYMTTSTELSKRKKVGVF